MSAPPIILTQFLSAVLKVKEAAVLQSLQIADNFVNFSHKGINSVIYAHFPR
jgi:hypothetical protein